MSDDTKKTLDLFGDFDIDQIQAEIEKDLAKSYTVIPPVRTVSAGSSISQPTASVYMVEESPKMINRPAMATLAAPVQSPSTATGDFYRETIKNTANRPPFAHWLKTAVAFILVFTLGTGTLGFGIGAGFGHFNRVEVTHYIQQDTPAQESATLTATTYTFEYSTASVGGTLADVIELVKPSVVSINTHYYATQPSPANLGSGVIFAETDDRVFIVTSNTVVRDMGRVLVSIDGSPLMDAHPAGNDTTVNMAVIYLYKAQLVDAGITSIVIATFGDSDAMRVGDTVLAIGNAMGEGNSVTRGVLSSLEVAAMAQSGHMLPLLQTDAAINYGTSGGPLINTRGEIVGININQIAENRFGLNEVEGMGYSVSSNIIAPLLDDIINGRRAAIGISGGTVTPDIAARFDVPTIGVFVSTVLEGGSAYRGGIQEQDIITGFNGLPVMNMQQLLTAIREAQIGDVVEVRILRYGTTAITVYVELDAMVFTSF